MKKSRPLSVVGLFAFRIKALGPGLVPLCLAIHLGELPSDLAHLNATLVIFNATLVIFASPERRTQFPIYMDTLRLFKPREIVALCKTALAAEGPLDTRELALRVIRAKGMDEDDNVLRRSIAFRIVQALTMQPKRGTITKMPKRKGVRMWKHGDSLAR